MFRTYEPTRDRLVAVKVFRLDVTPEQAQTLAAALSRAADAGLFHPSIVEPIAAGVEGTVAYRAEEYVAAESLDVAMRHYAPAALDKALPFITQLAGAIDFARTAGVGHGALHPRDIFVTPDEARATGFGVVEALERVGLRAPVRRPYSPPERIAGGAWSTPADVFSLAAIAYELLTGRRPSGTGEQIAPLDESNAGGHASALHAVLARAMHDEPARRFQSALAFAAALEAGSRGAQTSDAVTDVAAIAAPAVARKRTARAAKPQATKPEPAEPEPAGPMESREPEEPAQFAAIERDEDEAHHELSLHEPSGDEPLDDEHGADLFNEEAESDMAFAEAHPDRSVDDFAIEETASPERVETPDLLALDDEIRDEEPAAIDYSQVADPRTFSPIEEEVREDPRAAAAMGYDTESHPSTFLDAAEERPRHAMLPAAIGVVVGLLIGFAVGHVVGSRDKEGPLPVTSTQTAPGQSADRAAPGRPYSEQQITPQQAPPAATPPVPAETPSPAATPAPAAPLPVEPAATRGTIAVRSTPPGAAVTLNGSWRGRTPLTLDNLRFGPYTVRVVQPGYAVAREELTLSSAEPAKTMDVRLRPTTVPPLPGSAAPVPPLPGGSPTVPPLPESGATPPATSLSVPRTGSIYVDSRPRGARVFIDGRAVGVTPLRVPDVGVGAHTVRLELAQHRPVSTTTRVAPGQEARFTASLEPIR